jgi:FkbM family methyltransferase
MTGKSSSKFSVREAVKPFLFRILGKRFYKYAQCYGKMRDIKYQLADEKEMILLKEFIKPGDIVFDLGSNFAYYTERMSRMVGETGKVYAFEPIPFTYAVFAMIIKKLKLKNVISYKKGVSNKNEVVQFRVPKTNIGTFNTGMAHISNRNNNLDTADNEYDYTKEETFDCEIVALDDFFNSNMPGLSFIKIDIEGAELFALQGAKNLLAKYNPAILIEINPVFLEGFKLTQENVVSFINENGYEIFHLANNSSKLNIAETRPLWKDNFILIHKSKISWYNEVIDGTTRAKST